MGNEVLKIVLSLSLSGTIIGILLLLIAPLAKKYFSKSWMYYIWTLVILRLLLPITFGWNLTQTLYQSSYKENNIIQSAEASKDIADSPNIETISNNVNIKDRLQILNDIDTKDILSGINIKDATDIGILNDINTKDTTGISNAKESLNISNNTDDTYVSDNTSNSSDKNNAKADKDNKKTNKSNVMGTLRFHFAALLPYVWIVWVTVAVLLLVIKIVDYKGFLRYIKSNNKKIADEKILTLLDDISIQYKIKKEVQIYENPLIISPMLVGMISPILVIPKTCSIDVGFHHLLAHELIHYKRKDIFYKWLFQIVMCIHWFNPFLYLFRREMNRYCELSCDEAVIKRMETTERYSYGNMLLTVAELGVAYKNKVVSTSLIGDKKNLKERLEYIMNYKLRSKKAFFCSGACAFIMLLSTVLIGAKPVKGTAQEIPLETTSSIKSSYPNLPFSNMKNFLFMPLKNIESQISAKSNKEYNIKNDTKKAEKIYNNNDLICADDMTSIFNCWSYWGHEDGISVKKLEFTGSETLYIVNVSKDTTMKMQVIAELKSGRFKTIVYGEDKKVKTISEGTVDKTFEVSLSKGRNIIKMIGQNCIVEKIDIKFLPIDKKVFISKYRSEIEEKCDIFVKKCKTESKVDINQLNDFAYYMDEKDVTELLIQYIEEENPCAYEEDIVFDLVYYGDKKEFESYIINRLQSEKDISYGIISNISYYLGNECINEYLRYVAKHPDAATQEQIQELLYYADSEAVDDYIYGMIKSKKKISPDFIEDAASYLGSDALGAAILSVAENNPNQAFSLLEYVGYYMDKSDIAAVINKFLDQKIKITEYDIAPFYYYINKKDYQGILKRMVKLKMLTEEEKENLLGNYW